MEETNKYFELSETDAAAIDNFNPLISTDKQGFFLCTQGNISILSDDRLHKLSKGDIYVYSVFTQAMIFSYSPDLKGFAGYTNFDFVLSAVSNLSNTESHVYIRFNPLLSLDSNRFSRVTDLLQMTLRQTKIERQCRNSILYSLLQVFCFEILDAYEQASQLELKQQKREDELFQQFIAELYKNFDKHRDVKFYSERLCLTTHYFSTLVRKTSGHTPLQWISIFVIAEAKKQLLIPETSMQSISYKLNFPDQTTFSRYFKHYTGLTPSEYRQKAYKLSNQRA